MYSISDQGQSSQHFVFIKSRGKDFILLWMRGSVKERFSRLVCMREPRMTYLKTRGPCCLDSRGRCSRCSRRHSHERPAWAVQVISSASSSIPLPAYFSWSAMENKYFNIFSTEAVKYLFQRRQLACVVHYFRLLGFLLHKAALRWFSKKEAVVSRYSIYTFLIKQSVSRGALYWQSVPNAVSWYRHQAGSLSIFFL